KSLRRQIEDRMHTPHASGTALIAGSREAALRKRSSAPDDPPALQFSVFCLKPTIRLSQISRRLAKRRTRTPYWSVVPLMAAGRLLVAKVGRHVPTHFGRL